MRRSILGAIVSLYLVACVSFQCVLEIVPCGESPTATATAAARA